MVLFVGLVELALVRLWHAVLTAERALATNAALAVAEERLRFAADLHDIQGHRLQAIALKGELVAELIGRDDQAARTHAAEIAELARNALAETRALVQGYRRVSLGIELTNAVGVLRAAGIDTEIDGDDLDVPQRLQPLFGALVREGTTNVLRHSHATRCAITVAMAGPAVEVRMRNDGVRPPASDEGTGVAGLRERFGALGGQVRAGVLAGDQFELVGTVRPA
ncbi:sensor histidine kinase [Actinocrispum wychmicini]|uniref:Histidine kinase n=1 Tax=Actinocrispum wychmicini TaxID=1213861 RepID=A0A4R2J5I6_9PSEU|nr:histidine kinase [Actinocrispum wychmicini]TCO54123.1 histidine kinase [Actinocrispum wychmicini]